MRITGLATGLDVDSIVKDTMQAYRTKIDVQSQKKEILQIKQQLYRDVINESRQFYEKYFSGTGENNLLLTKNWSTTKFQSDDEGVVSINSQGGAKAENYSVVVAQLASTAKTTLTTDEVFDNDKISIEVMVGDEKKTIEVSTKKQVSAEDGTTSVQSKTNTEIIDELNAEFKRVGSDINASYSQFSKGIVLESKEMGEAVKFSIGTYKDGEIPTMKEVAGTDALAVIYKGNEAYKHTGNTNKVTLDGIEFKFNSVSKVNSSSGTPTFEETRIVGKNDTKAIAEKLVAFFDEYNGLMEKINTLTTEKRNRNYDPLTADQKKELSEDEIKL